MALEDQIKDAHDALVNADKAGDTEAARVIADHIVSLQSQLGQQETKPEQQDKVIPTAAATAVGGATGLALGRGLQSGIREEFPRLYRNPAGAAPQPTNVPNVTVVGAPEAPKTGGEKWIKALTGADVPGTEMDKKSLKLVQGMQDTVGRGGELAGGKITESGIMLGPKAAAETTAAAEAAAAAAQKPSLASRAMGAIKSASPAAVNRGVGHVLHGMTSPWLVNMAANTLGGAATAAQGMDAYQRLKDPNQGWVRGAISGLGALGSGAAMTRIPVAMPVGMAVGAAAPFINEYLDKWAAENPEAAKKWHLAEGGSIKPVTQKVAGKPVLMMQGIKTANMIKKPVQNFAGGKLVEEGVGLAKKGYDFVKGYLESTPKKPNPLVGTRYETQNVVDLVPIKPGKIEDIKDAVVQANPWDDTSRGVQVQSVSGKRLTKPVETHGGQPYVRDPEHVRQNIGGSSNKGIATRVQNRANEGSIEGLNMGGSGEVILMPSTMGQFSGNFAKPTWEIYNDLFKQAEPNKQTVRELSDRMRSTKIRGRMPFEFAPDLMTEDAARIFENNPDFRKSFVQMMQLKNNQKLLGVNAEDISNAMADPNLLGVPRGFVGHTGIEMVPGAELRPSTNVSYDTDWSGKYRLSLPHTPMQVMMKRRYDEILPEISAMYPNKTPAQLDAMTLGALETRSKGVSELMDEEAINRIGQYHEGLKQGAFDPHDVNAAMDYLNKPGRYAEGGEVQHMAEGKRTAPTLDELRQVIKGVDVPGKIKSVARGVPQMITGPLDMLGAISEGVGITPEGGTVGSTEWLTNHGYLPPPQEGVGNQTTEMVSSLGPANLITKIPQAARTGLNALGNMFRGSHAPAPTHVPAMAGGGETLKALLNAAKGVGSRMIEGSPHTYPPIVPEGTQWMRDYQPAPRPAPKITYMGKYSPRTQENYMVEKQGTENAIRDAMDQRKAQWIARSKQMGMTDEQIADEIAHSFGDFPWMP